MYNSHPVKLWASPPTHISNYLVLWEQWFLSIDNSGSRLGLSTGQVESISGSNWNLTLISTAWSSTCNLSPPPPPPTPKKKAYIRWFGWIRIQSVKTNTQPEFIGSWRPSIHGETTLFMWSEKILLLKYWIMLCSFPLSKRKKKSENWSC